MFCVLVEINTIKCLLGLLSMNSIFVHSKGSSCSENNNLKNLKITFVVPQNGLIQWFDQLV